MIERARAGMEALAKGDIARYAPALLRSIAQDGDDACLETLASAPGAYTRTCVHECGEFELVLLNWAPGSISEIHDHGGQMCWFAVLRGGLHVANFRRIDNGANEGYAKLAGIGAARLVTGDLDTRLADVDVHRVANPYETRAVSLHVYARPLRTYRIFDERAETWALATSHYDARL